MVEAGPQEFQQLDLQIVARREIGMPALASKHVMPGSVPEQACLAQPRTRRDYGLIAHGRTGDPVQRDQVARFQRSDSPRAGFQVVDQKCCGNMSLLRQLRLFDDPGKVRGFNSTVAHWTGNAETRDLRMCAGFIQKAADDLAEFE